MPALLRFLLSSRAQLDGLNIGVYSDGGIPLNSIYAVIRFEKETAVTVMFPDNPVARESVTPLCSGTEVRVRTRRRGRDQWHRCAD